MESSFNAADQLFELLNTNGYQGQPEFISAVEDFAPCLQEQLWDLILVNPRIGNNALATVCKTLARMAIDIPVIALPDRPDVISVVEAMRIGAKDLVLRGDDQHLLLVIRREIDSLAARRERARLLSSPRQTEEVTPAAGSAKRRNGKDHSYVSSRRDTIDASGNQPAPAQSDRRNTTAGATGGKSDNDNHHTQTVQNQSDPKAVLAALAANRLSLVFQPIVSLENEADRIFELFPQLIAHDNHIVSSQALYATMPENMAKRLDSRIIERAGKLIIDQQIAGEHVHFFIRLSNQAVVNPTIVQQVEQLVFGNALDPQRLILEFPEAAVAGRLEQAQEMIQSLDQLGCSSALYDSGLSSNASQLIEQLDIRYVKLAGSLIADYGKQPDQLERMLKALQRAAKARNAILIASDVPDGHTLSTFWKYGIDYIQGDHIQSPQPRPEYDFA
jgi:EAL domain-containing protein (putative c-di-GMP-specific phosphodiesterase class I)/DNA-binding NarL/FixJ family response regulator